MQSGMVGTMAQGKLVATERNHLEMQPNAAKLMFLPLQDTKYVTYSCTYNVHVHVHCIAVPGCNNLVTTCACTLYM